MRRIVSSLFGLIMGLRLIPSKEVGAKRICFSFLIFPGNESRNSYTSFETLGTLTLAI